MKKLKWIWINFWGKRFWIIKDEKTIQEILFYHHKIYILKDYINKEKGK
jgi:hypothetical protein